MCFPDFNYGFLTFKTNVHSERGPQVKAEVSKKSRFSVRHELGYAVDYTIRNAGQERKELRRILNNDISPKLNELDFHGAGYKPSPLGGNVFSKYFPWLYILSMISSKSDWEDELWEKNVIGAVLIQ